MGPGVSLVLWPPNREKASLCVSYRPEGYVRTYPVLPPGGRFEDGVSPTVFLRLGIGFQVSTLCFVYAFDLFCNSLAITGSNQAYRAISTGQLNALLRLHLRPIDVVVYHGPQGYLVLRGASRLDAFSGYPVRT